MSYKENGFENEDMVNLYLNKQPIEYQPIIQYILKNTVYYTKLQIIDSCIELLKEWLPKNIPKGKLGVVVDSGKIGSKHWILSMCKDYLPHFQLVSKDNYKSVLPNITHLLYLDDCIITGHQSLNIFDQFSYDFDCEHISVIQLVAVSPEKSELFRAMKPNNWLGKKYHSYTFKSKYTFQGLEESKFNSKFLEKYSTEEEVMAPIHMEYKIADSFCVWSEIYKNCRPPPDREFMKCITL
jgi:hypothetical protein